MWNSNAAAGTETPNARQPRGGGRADVDPCGPAKPVQPSAADEGRRHRRADMGNSYASAVEASDAANARETPAASKAWRDRGADPGHSRGVKLMKAAAKAAVEAAAGDARRYGGASVETRRCVNAAGTEATKA